jgi:hypothetical protein
VHVHDENVYPAAGVSSISTFVDELYHPFPGASVPAPTGFDVSVR